MVAMAGWARGEVASARLRGGDGARGWARAAGRAGGGRAHWRRRLGEQGREGEGHGWLNGPLVGSVRVLDFFLFLF
jgi:hypothetical protein